MLAPAMTKSSSLVTVATVASLLTLIIMPCSGSGIFPNISDNSHASPEAVEFFDGYFTAKSLHNATAWLSYFDPVELGYFDATLGFAANESEWQTEVEDITKTWAANASSDRSYPLRIIGDTTAGAIVYFVDTPGLFGFEIRLLSTIDFVEGKIIRQVDRWNGRLNVNGSSSIQVVPDDQYPYDLGLSLVSETAAAEMITVANQLNDALSTGNATAAAALFDYNAIFEDLTLSARIEGQIAIQAYLLRALGSLPYGTGTNLTHVLGNAQGGGYEWRPGTGSVLNGVTALELNVAGNITRLTTVWDGSRLNETAIQALALLTPTP